MTAGKKTSVYLSADLQCELDASGLTLIQAVRAGLIATAAKTAEPARPRPPGPSRCAGLTRSDWYRLAAACGKVAREM
jgi:hypothetical protein